MINLLPPKEKEQLILQKNRNLTVVLLSMTILFLLFFSLILLFLKFYILQRVIHQNQILEDAKLEYQTADFISLKDSIKEYNTKLNKIRNFYVKQIYFSGSLKSFIGIPKPKGVNLNSIALQKIKTDNNKLKAVINGASASREDLISFRDEIKKQENIENVYFPAETWVKSADINFHATFEIKPVKIDDI